MTLPNSIILHSGVQHISRSCYLCFHYFVLGLVFNCYLNISSLFLYLFVLFSIHLYGISSFLCFSDTVHDSQLYTSHYFPNYINFFIFFSIYFSLEVYFSLYRTMYPLFLSFHLFSYQSYHSLQLLFLHIWNPSIALFFVHLVEYNYIITNFKWYK